VIGVAEIPEDAQRPGLHDLLATEAPSTSNRSHEQYREVEFEPLPNGPVEFYLHYDFITLSTDEGASMSAELELAQPQYLRVARVALEVMPEYSATRN
jgi:hypothetical protein